MKVFFKSDKLTTKHRRYALVISIFFTLFIVLALLQMYKYKVSAANKAYQKELKTAVEISKVFVTEEIENASTKIDYLSKSDEIQDYIVNGSQPYVIDEVKDLFSKYIDTFNAVTQVRLLDAGGMEIIRLNKTEGQVEIVNDNELQNKSDRYYFIESTKVDSDQVYVSDFDLNVENGVVVTPYEPTIRLSKKLVNNSGVVMGYIIINFDGYQFFKVISEYEVSNKEYEEIGILDYNNYWSLTDISIGDQRQLELIVSEKENTETSTLLLNKLSEAAPFGVIEENGITYIYQRLTFSDKMKFSNQETPWYVIGKYDIALLMKSEQFFIYNFLPLAVVTSLIGSLFAFVISSLIQTRLNNNLLLMASSNISDNSHDGIVILDDKKRIVYCNQVFEEIFGFSKKDLIDREIGKIFDNNIAYQNTDDDDGLLWSGTVWNKTQYGNVICKNLEIRVVKDANGRIKYYLGIYSNPDATQFAIEEQEAYSMNAYLLSTKEMNIIAQTLEEELGGIENYIIFAIQLTGNVRKLFDTNQMLHGSFLTNAHKLKTEEMMIQNLDLIAVPRTDLLIVVLKQPISKTGAHIHLDETYVEEVVHKIETMFKKIQIAMNLEQLDFSFIMGAAIHNQHGSDSRSVFINALIALETLIKFRKSNYLIYDKSFYEYVKKDILIRQELKNAFTNNEFYMAYQPQYYFSSGELFGFEALIRWQNKDLGLIQPEKFIPMLEESGNIKYLGKHVCDLILDDLNRLDYDLQGLRISINLSSTEFLDDRVLKDIIDKKQAFDQLGLTFCIELTETVLIENMSLANATIQMLHDEGIEVSIDDFGTGYSSLSYLKQLYADELKIDRMFIEDYPDLDDGKMVKAVIGMGQEMNFSLVMEGVETEDQYQLVKESGCQICQGFYLSKPLDIVELDFHLKSILGNHNE